MAAQKNGSSIVKRMFIAVAAGFVVGFLCLFLKAQIGGSSGWKMVEAILFQDITATKSIEGIGLFYIIGQLFMRGLQMMIVPLVLTSLSLALCSLADPQRLGKIAARTFVTYGCFYVVAAALAACAAYFVKSIGGFNVVLPGSEATALATMDGYNPLVTVVNAVPSNIISAMSTNNSILSVVVFAVILGLCMTINMNGTTAMHMCAITFIGTAAGLDVTPTTLALAAFLSICTAVGTPAIPVAGTTMVYVVMMGLGMNSELCLIGYSLVLAMNYLPGMAVITLNVIGDATTNVIVNAKEGTLDKAMYNKM